jgi:hypothetical protein
MANLRATVYPTVGSGILLGSITGIIKNHIISKLPKNYIKYVYIKNSIPSVSEKDNNEEDYMVKDKPALSLGLNYSYNEAVSIGDNFKWGMSRIPVNTYMYDSIYTKIFMNETDHIYLTSIDERTKLVFDVAIRLDSETQAYNLMQFMRSYIGVSRPFYLQSIDVEVPLPFECLYLIASAKNFNLTNKPELINFHDYLRKYSGGRITYKKNLSSGNFNYFMKYNCNILCKIPDIPSIERTTEGKSVIDSMIRYNMEIEFPSYTNFITEYEEFDMTPNDQSTNTQLGNSENSAVYNFTSKFHFGRMEGDKTIALTFEFISDINTAIDETPFKDSLSEPLNFFIEHQKQFLLSEPDSVSKYIKILMMRDSDLLTEGIDYEIDWDKYTIRLLNPWFNYTYHLAFYIDLVAYNSVMMIRNTLSLNQNLPIQKIVEVKNTF